MARKLSKLSNGSRWMGEASTGTFKGGISAAGTTQAGATLLNDDLNIVTTAAASSGVRLGDLECNDTITVVNYGANPVNLYPKAGGKLNNGTVNAAVAIGAGKCALVFALANGLDCAVLTDTIA